MNLDALLRRARDSFAGTILAQPALSWAAVLLSIAAAAALCAAAPAALIAVTCLFFFPALLLTVLMCGWRFGILAWITATIIVWAVASGGDAPTAMYEVAAFAFAAGLMVVISGFAHAVLFDRERLRSRLLKLLDASQGFMFVTDAAGHPLAHNPRWTTMTGMRWDDYHTEGWTTAIHPDDRDRLPLNAAAPSPDDIYDIELRVRDARGDWRWHRMRVVAVKDRLGNIAEWIGTLRDIHEHKSESQQRELVLSEARHRLKNLMAIVETLARYSAPRPGTDPGVDEFLKRFTGRLHALTAASDALLTGQRRMIEAGTVIRATLAPFMGDTASRIHLDGPDLELPEDFGGSLAMAVHELATNAIKYGALSKLDGSVSFVWVSEPAEDGERIRFDWKERGGPAPQVPAKEGFGSRMIRSVTARERGGGVTIDYEPDGLRCRIVFMRRPSGETHIH